MRYSPAKTSAGMPTINASAMAGSWRRTVRTFCGKAPQGLLKQRAVRVQWLHGMVSHDALQQESPHLCQLPTRAGGVTALKTTQERQSVHLARIGGRLGQRLQTLEKLHARTGGGKKNAAAAVPCAIARPLPGVGAWPPRPPGATTANCASRTWASANFNSRAWLAAASSRSMRAGARLS